MRVVVSADEDGPLPRAVVEALRRDGHKVDALGPGWGDEREWAALSMSAARRVVDGDADLAVVICWTGTGASIAANKIPGIRAALCIDAETARMARKYNHANVLALSMRSTTEALGIEILDAFLASPLGDDNFDIRNVAHLDDGKAAESP